MSHRKHPHDPGTGPDFGPDPREPDREAAPPPPATGEPAAQGPAAAAPEAADATLRSSGATSLRAYSAEAAASAAKAGSTSERLAAKTRECEETFDRLQRLAAEYANYQKRMARQLDQVQQSANRDLVLDLLPVIDNFERALAAAEAESDFAAFRDGVQLVHDQLLAALAKHGVTRVAAQDEAFDPEHHEAVAQVPSDEHPEGRVVEVAQTGYRMHGRILRPSRVVVSGGPAGAGPPEPGAAEDGGRPSDEPEEERGAFDADV
jgi:molecular chaperone GrpE